MTDGAAEGGAHSAADRAALEQKMMAMYERLEGMADAAPAAAEEAHRWIREQCTDPHLAGEFKDKVLEKARALDCNAHMRATGAALADAARLATEGRMPERSAKLIEAQTFYSKACNLGANDHFRRATGRLIETVLMTGGGRHVGPSVAKPLDTAPKNPRQAKV